MFPRKIVQNKNTMNIQSEFRKALPIRILIGFLSFTVALFYVLYNFFTGLNLNPLFVMVCILLLFLIYCSLDLFEIFKLTITDEGLEKITIITGKKEFIPFEDIINIKRGKIKIRNRRGDLSNGFHFSTLVLRNNKSIIISPDHFSNYNILMEYIREKF